MIPAVPLDTVSVKPTAVDGWLEIVAWVTVVVLLTLLWVSRSYLRYRATDPGERRHIRELRPQLLAGTSVTVRIKRGFDREDVLERLRAGFDREDVLEESDATVRDVAAGLASAAANARPSWVPVLAWRGILEGALLLVAGLVAFAPLAYWRAAVDPSPPVSAGEAAPLAATGVSIGVSALSTFPYSELVYGLVLATGILGVSGLWGSWLLPAAVLVAGGLGLTWLHREIATWDSVPDDARIGRRRSRASLRLLSWGVGLWAVGVGLSSSARAVDGLVEADLAGFAAPVGFLAAVIAALIGVGLWVRRTVRRINELGETHPAETSAVVAYLVLRRVYLALAVVAAGLLVGYAGYAVITGRVVEVLAVVASAPTWVLGILGLAVLSLFVIAVLQLPGVLEDLRDLASRVTRSTALRLWVFARGVPIVGTVATFALVLAMSASIVAAGGTSILVGAVLRGIGSLIVRMKYAALRRYSGLERPVKEVHIAPFRVEDADGEGIWVADVDGTRLAHRELETLLEDVADSVRERTNTGKWPYYGPTTESEHYYHRVEMGFVDLERFRTKLRAATRLRTRVFLKDHGGELDDETARDELADDYPEWLVDDGITELRRRGIVDKRNDKLVLKG